MTTSTPVLNSNMAHLPCVKAETGASSAATQSIDPIELVQKSVFLSENALIFANAASNKAWKVAKKTVGLSATRTLQASFTTSTSV